MIILSGYNLKDNHHEKKELLREKFVRELKFGNYSPRTIATYLNMLVQLSKYFNGSPAGITSEQLKEYLYHCKEKRGLSNSFINQTISAVKILRTDVLGLEWDEGIHIKRPGNTSYLPDILSKEHVNKLIEVTVNPKHKAIIAVQYSTGMRMDELIHLKLADIDSERMVIRITNGKGNKSRDAILAERALELLRKYY